MDKGSHLCMIPRAADPLVCELLIRSAKLAPHDTGLPCWLPGIQAWEQLSLHCMQGAVFDTLVGSDTPVVPGGTTDACFVCWELAGARMACDTVELSVDKIVRCTES